MMDDLTKVTDEEKDSKLFLISLLQKLSEDLKDLADLEQKVGKIHEMVIDMAKENSKLVKACELTNKGFIELTLEFDKLKTRVEDLELGDF